MKKTKLLCKSLAASITISALSGCSAGISSYEKLIEQLQTGMNEQDGEIIAQVYLTEGMIAYAEKEEDMDYDDIIDEIEDDIDDEVDYWEDLCGDDVVYTAEIKDADEIDDEDDIEKIVKAYDKKFDEEIEIKEAYEIKCRMKIKGEDDSEKTTEELIAINITGQGWKISVADLDDEKSVEENHGGQAAPSDDNAYEDIDLGSMSDYVKSSKVTSANSTAASLKNNIDTFLTAADTAGYGMVMSNSNYDMFYITVDDFVWTVSAGTPSNYKTGTDMYWGGEGKGTANMQKAGITSPETLLAIEFANLFPEIENASIFAFCQGGRCRAVAYTNQTNDKLTPGADCPDIIFSNGDYTGEWATDFKWGDEIDGITSNGRIVGTSPMYAD